MRVRPAALRKVWVLPGFGRKRHQERLLRRLAGTGVEPGVSRGFSQDMVPAGAAHQGIVAEVEPFWEADFDALDPGGRDVFVACDHLEDPHNLGAVLRSCSAFGVKGVILPRRRSAVINGTVVKASSGGIFYLDVYRVPNVVNALRTLGERGVEVAGLSPDGDVPLSSFRSQGPVLLVLGAEGRGLRPLVKRWCHRLLQIPMAREVGSLNVSVTAGIALYHICGLAGGGVGHA